MPGSSSGLDTHNRKMFYNALDYHVMQSASLLLEAHSVTGFAPAICQHVNSLVE